MKAQSITLTDAGGMDWTHGTRTDATGAIVLLNGAANGNSADFSFARGNCENVCLPAFRSIRGLNNLLAEYGFELTAKIAK